MVSVLFILFLGTTSHIWHSGKAVYTLIKIPSSKDSHEEAEIKEIVMGPDIAKGEQMQLIVEKGWWKRSALAEGSEHCLITEIVCPAWHPEDHAFMTSKTLKDLFGDKQDMIGKYMDHTSDEDIVEQP